MNTSTVIQELKILKPKYAQDGIIILGLFGSYAKGNATSTSDIDIAIKLQDDYLRTHDVWSYFNNINSLKADIHSKFGLRCDVLDMDSTSAIVKQIKNEVLYV